MSTEKEDLLLRHLRNMGYTWGQAMVKIDEVKWKDKHEENNSTE